MVVGSLRQATSNSAIYTDSRSNDFIISTDKLGQRFLIGFSSNYPSSFSLGNSNLIIGSSASNVDIKHYGNTRSTGNTDIDLNLTASNAYITNTIGIGSSTFDTKSNIKLYVAGSARFEGDVIVNGNIESINTNVTVTDEFQVVNNGTGPALTINQLGATPIALFETASNQKMLITNDGKISIGSNAPLERLDVQGNQFLRGNLNLSNIFGSNSTFNFSRVYSNLDVDINITAPNAYHNNLYMGNKLIIDNTGVITNSNYIPTLDTSKVQYGTFTSNFIEDYNVISSKLHSNLTIAGKTFFDGVVGIGTSNPAYGNPFVKLRVSGGDTLVTGANDFKTTGDQARMYIGNSAYFIAATSNVGLVMQVPNTSYPFVLEENSGFVGLGVMDPEERLHLANNAKVNNNLYVMNRVAVGHSNPLETVAISGNLSLSNYGKIVMYTSNDFLGINTSEPIARLHVLHPSNGNAFLVEDAFSPDTSPFIIKEDGRVGVGLVNPTELMDISGGNVKISSNVYAMSRIGIKNSNPNYDADISGSVRLQNDIYVDGGGSKGASMYLCSKATPAEGKGAWLIENSPYGNTGSNCLRLAKFDCNNSIIADNSTLWTDEGYVRIGGQVRADERLHVSHGHVKIDSNLYVYGRTGMNTSNPTEVLDLAVGNAKITSNVYVMTRLGVGTSNPEYTVDVAGDINLTGQLRQGSGDATFNASLYVMNSFGIGTSNPTESFSLSYGNADLGSNLYVYNRIGVTTKTPSERIDVASGNIKASSNIYSLSRVAIAHSNPTEALDIVGNQKISNNIYTFGRQSIGHSNPTESLDIIGNLKVSQNVYALNRIGIAMSNPQVALEINATDAILIPKGGTLQRPSVPVQGHVRYNEDINTFEGFGAGMAWGSLGGVKDTNQDTYISAESYPTSNDDIIRFYTSNNEIARIMPNGRFGISNNSPSERLELNGGNAKFNSNIYILGRQAISHSNPTEALDVIGNTKISQNLYALNRIGIAMSNPQVALEINATDAILLPKGGTLQRPAVPVQGHVRYNSDINTFEGFGAGNAWGSLGGVKDTNQDTYISAESYPTSNDDILRFYNSNNETMRIMPNGLIGISNNAPSERLELNGGNAKFNSNIYTLGRHAIGHSNPTESIDLIGNLKASQNIYALSRMGIATSNPAVTLEIVGTDAVLIPKGTTGQRPTPQLGHIRYNTSYQTFEGFGAGNAWGSLGGVKDTNQDTYISAESYPTSNDDIIRFYTSNNEIARIMPDGRFGISNQDPSERLELSGGNAKFNSNVYIGSRLGVGLSNPEQALHVVGNVRATNGTQGPMIMLIPPIAYADVGVSDRLVLDNTLEAGNDISSSTYKALFYGNGFLYQDLSTDNMSWNEARFIFRGTALSQSEPEYTSMSVQDYLYSRTPQYSNISQPFTIVSQNYQRGYFTSASPWFSMSTSEVRHLAIYINSSSNNSSYRFGSVYLQFRG